MQISVNNQKISIKTKQATITMNDNLKINDFEVSGPGEYEVGGVMVYGLTKGGYVLKDEEFGFCWLVNRDEEIDEKKLEDLPDVEILFITLSDDLNKDLKNIKIIEPKIIVPAGGPERIKEFIEKEGNVERVDGNLKITRMSLPLDGQKIYIFNNGSD
ncbi:MAG: hypothetical protein CEN91_273 [Candidatus Berkelbacteria bacterium Licking1014_85]|uniref:Uncharacterized protein n=1 Tax=Candidatus Berkelbacteria bacterium Licking1014_85 TaxID=2017148 RepID=A0A554LK27_9BACT|nr:MAG: hypothetical protein CEN91_273 [Candidatus Berkelbacteria bacterium Licking1014_85]